MRKIYLLINLLSLLFIPIGSCEDPSGMNDSEHWNNYGYESEVNFPQEGDTIVLNGENAFKEIGIEPITYSDEICANFGNKIDGDTIIVWYDWLTAKTVKGSHSLTLIAAPSKSRFERSLSVTGYFQSDNDYVELAIISVIQKK